jgi:hypothetical protein
MASKEITFKISVDVTGSPPETSVDLFAMEPLTIGTPQGELIGYVSDDDQLRWVPEGGPSYPGYRKLYVEKRS